MSLLCLLIGGAWLTTIHFLLQEGQPLTQALCSAANYLYIFNILHLLHCSAHVYILLCFSNLTLSSLRTQTVTS